MRRSRMQFLPFRNDFSIRPLGTNRFIMSDYWGVRGGAHGWEEQLYPDADDEDGVEDETTE